MSIDFHALRRGDRLPPIAFTVTLEDVRAYLAATGEAAGTWSAHVPPLALGAYILAGLMEVMPLPPGALHAGQEFEFLDTVAQGEPLEAELTVAQQSERQGSDIVVFASELKAGERVVLRGRTTVMAPVATSEAG
ncbi:MAG: MaoC family dehydratase [Dehalococcoidia bacterium]